MTLFANEMKQATSKASSSYKNAPYNLKLNDPKPEIRK